MRALLAVSCLGFTALIPSAAVTLAQTGKGDGDVQKGRAAFYSKSLEGHKTACGGTYSAKAMTIAHRSLKCGTKVRITNLKNGRSIEAVVNDHGPASHRRLVDVSYAAAEELGFVKQGTTTVELEVLR